MGANSVGKILWVVAKILSKNVRVVSRIFTCLQRTSSAINAAGGASSAQKIARVSNCANSASLVSI